MIGVVSLLILVGIIVALVLVLGGDEEMKLETVPPITSAPTTQATPMPAGERFSLLINQLESNNVTAPLVDLFPDNPDYYDPSYLEGLVNNDYCKSKAFDCAMSWILYEDAFPPESNDIVDRFGLAAFDLLTDRMAACASQICTGDEIYGCPRTLLSLTRLL